MSKSKPSVYTDTDERRRERIDHFVRTAAMARKPRNRKAYTRKDKHRLVYV